MGGATTTNQQHQHFQVQTLDSGKIPQLQLGTFLFIDNNCFACFSSQIYEQIKIV